MARKKKNGVNVNYYIDKNISDMLDIYAEYHGMAKVVVVERALDQFMNEFFDKHPEMIPNENPISDDDLPIN